MDEKRQLQMIEDIAYIKNKVEYIPELKTKIDKNTDGISENKSSISRLKGVLGALSVFAGLVLPFLFTYFEKK